jgi:hypothetical protein
MPSPDGRRVSWVDFRDYTGVFTGPAAADSDCFDGSPWHIQDLHFDRSQYISEIRRASGGRSWETRGGSGPASSPTGCEPGTWYSRQTW